MNTGTEMHAFRVCLSLPEYVPAARKEALKTYALHGLSPGETGKDML